MGTKVEWFIKNGFNKDGNTYCVTGGNTYAIKEILKQNKYKFSRLLNWHAAAAMELPRGYSHVVINFYDIYKWDEESNMAFLFPDAETIVKSKLEKEEKKEVAETPSNSDFVGKIGERIRNLTAVYCGCRGFDSFYGYKYAHHFKSGNSMLCWITLNELYIPENAVVDLTGTVKNHKTYKDTKTTYLSRCVVKQIGSAPEEQSPHV